MSISPTTLRAATSIRLTVPPSALPTKAISRPPRCACAAPASPSASSAPVHRIASPPAWSWLRRPPLRQPCGAQDPLYGVVALVTGVLVDGAVALGEHHL